MMEVFLNLLKHQQELFMCADTINMMSEPASSGEGRFPCILSIFTVHKQVLRLIIYHYQNSVGGEGFIGIHHIP